MNAKMKFEEKDREIQLSVHGKDEDVELFLKNLKKAFMRKDRPGLWIGDLFFISMGMKTVPAAAKGMMCGNIKFRVVDEVS